MCVYVYIYRERERATANALPAWSPSGLSILLKIVTEHSVAKRSSILSIILWGAQRATTWLQQWSACSLQALALSSMTGHPMWFHDAKNQRG